jgi:tetratricopeptide (TPR) repeat protein
MAMRLCLAFIILFSMTGSWPAFAQNSSETQMAQIYNKAGKHYAKGEYKQALDLYNSIETESADLYFNRACAYFKTGDIGQAILYFERVKRFGRYTEEVEHNLRLLRNLKKDKEKENDTGFANLLVSFFPTPVNSASYIFALFNTLLFASVIVYLFVIAEKKRKKARNIAFIFLVLWAGAFQNLLKSREDFESRKTAIATDKEINALSGPDKNANHLFTFHAGTKVILGRAEGEFIQVTLSTGLTGFVPRTSVTRI